MKLEFTLTKQAPYDWCAEATQQVTKHKARRWRGQGASAWAALTDAMYQASEMGWIPKKEDGTRLLTVQDVTQFSKPSGGEK